MGCTGSPTYVRPTPYSGYGTSTVLVGRVINPHRTEHTKNFRVDDGRDITLTTTKEPKFNAPVLPQFNFDFDDSKSSNPDFTQSLCKAKYYYCLLPFSLVVIGTK